MWFPDFPLQYQVCQRPELKDSAFAFYHEVGQRISLQLCSEAATEVGLRPGLPLAEAQALGPDTEFLPIAPEGDLAELRRLADVCYRFSPTASVELTENNHCLLLDISGCGHLFGGDEILACQLTSALAQQGYYVHVAVADTVGAAWAVARYGHASDEDRSLPSLPIAALRLPRDTLQTLREFDLTTIQQVTDLPRESLPSRFGTRLTERIDQLFGQLEEILEPLDRPNPVKAEWITEDPINHPKAVRWVCEDLLTELLESVRRQCQGILQLEITFRSEEAAPVLLPVVLTEPTLSLPHLMNLLDLKLETTTTPEWLFAIEMEATVTTNIIRRQVSLFGDDWSVDGSEYQRLVDRLAARLGNDRVVKAELKPEVAPERTVAWVSQDNPKPSSHIVSQSQRPLILFRPPEPIQVSFRPAIAGENQQLHSVTWKRKYHVVVKATRPERMVTDWWQDEGMIRRNYFVVDLDTGTRLWIYYENRRWYAHGLFE